MKLEQSFEVTAPLEQVWRTLIDVEHVAPCLPGAAVTGRNDDGSYNGTFTVKIGPTTASYTGKLEMENIDEASHTATMNAQGTDKRGQGGAKATILSRLAPADGHGTRVEVVTDYHITGRLARFGRGGMIEDISERLLREFAKRLQSSLEAQPETSAAPAAGGSAAAEPAAMEASPAADTVVSSPPADTVVSSPPAEVAEPAAEAAQAVSPLEPAPFRTDWDPPATHDAPAAPVEPVAEHAAGDAPAESEPGVTGSAETPPPAPPAPEPPPVTPPPPSAAAPPPQPSTSQTPPLDNPPMPSEPMQGLSLMGSVVWGRVKRNPAPVAAAGIAVVLLMARRRRRRHGH
jgi:uncharacterized protein